MSLQPNRSASDLRRARNKVNNELAELSQRFHYSIPLTDIQMLLGDFGFDLEPGICTGRDGRSNEPVGDGLYLSLTWHKLEITGLWEITAYIS